MPNQTRMNSSARKSPRPSANKMKLNALVLLGALFGSLALVEAGQGGPCMWCDPRATAAFLGCVQGGIRSDPDFAAIPPSQADNMRSSLEAAALAMKEGSGASRTRMMNGALAGELTEMIRACSTPQTCARTTRQLMGIVADCYVQATGGGPAQGFMKDVGNLVTSMLQSQASASAQDGDAGASSAAGSGGSLDGPGGYSSGAQSAASSGGAQSSYGPGGYPSGAQSAASAASSGGAQSGYGPGGYPSGAQSAASATSSGGAQNGYSPGGYPSGALSAASATGSGGAPNGNGPGGYPSGAQSAASAVAFESFQNGYGFGASPSNAQSGVAASSAAAGSGSGYPPQPSLVQGGSVSGGQPNYALSPQQGPSSGSFSFGSQNAQFNGAPSTFFQPYAGWGSYPLNMGFQNSAPAYGPQQGLSPYSQNAGGNPPTPYNANVPPSNNNAPAGNFGPQQPGSNYPGPSNQNLPNNQPAPYNGNVQPPNNGDSFQQIPSAQQGDLGLQPAPGFGPSQSAAPQNTPAGSAPASPPENMGTNPNSNAASPSIPQQQPPAPLSDDATSRAVRFAETFYITLYSSDKFNQLYKQIVSNDLASITFDALVGALSDTGYKQNANEIADSCIVNLQSLKGSSPASKYVEELVKCLMIQFTRRGLIGSNPEEQAKTLALAFAANLQIILSSYSSQAQSSAATGGNNRDVGPQNVNAGPQNGNSAAAASSAAASSNSGNGGLQKENSAAAASSAASSTNNGNGGPQSGNAAATANSAASSNTNRNAGPKSGNSAGLANSPAYRNNRNVGPQQGNSSAAAASSAASSTKNGNGGPQSGNSAAAANSAATGGSSQQRPQPLNLDAFFNALQRRLGQYQSIRLIFNSSLSSTTANNLIQNLLADVLTPKNGKSVACDIADVCSQKASSVPPGSNTNVYIALISGCLTDGLSYYGKISTKKTVRQANYIALKIDKWCRKLIKNSNSQNQNSSAPLKPSGPSKPQTINQLNSMPPPGSPPKIQTSPKPMPNIPQTIPSQGSSVNSQMSPKPMLNKPQNKMPPPPADSKNAANNIAKLKLLLKKQQNQAQAKPRKNKYQPPTTTTTTQSPSYTSTADSSSQPTPSTLASTQSPTTPSTPTLYTSTIAPISQPTFPTTSTSSRVTTAPPENPLAPPAQPGSSNSRNAESKERVKILMKWAQASISNGTFNYDLFSKVISGLVKYIQQKNPDTNPIVIIQRVLVEGLIALSQLILRVPTQYFNNNSNFENADMSGFNSLSGIAGTSGPSQPNNMAMIGTQNTPQQPQANAQAASYASAASAGPQPQNNQAILPQSGPTYSSQNMNPGTLNGPNQGQKTIPQSGPTYQGPNTSQSLSNQQQTAPTVLRRNTGPQAQTSPGATPNQFPTDANQAGPTNQEASSYAFSQSGTNYQAVNQAEAGKVLVDSFSPQMGTQNFQNMNLAGNQGNQYTVGGNNPGLPANQGLNDQGFLTGQQLPMGNQEAWQGNRNFGSAGLTDFNNNQGAVQPYQGFMPEPQPMIASQGPWQGAGGPSQNPPPNTYINQGPTMNNQGPYSFNNQGPDLNNQAPNGFNNPAPGAFGNQGTQQSFQGPNSYTNEGPGLSNQNPNGFNNQGPDMVYQNPAGFNSQGQEVNNQGPNMVYQNPAGFNSQGQTVNNAAPNGFQGMG